METATAIALLLALLAASSAAAHSSGNRKMIQESEDWDGFNPDPVTNREDLGGGVADYAWGAPEITYPTSGLWGYHITVQPNATDVLISWYANAPVISTPSKMPALTSCAASFKPRVYVTTAPPARGTPRNPDPKFVFTGSSIAYRREYETPRGEAIRLNSYFSPCIQHVLVTGLTPKTKYTYFVSQDGGRKWTRVDTFATLGDSGETSYPLRLGLVGDLGQTANSSRTRDQLIANQPDAFLLAGDFCYADVYSATVKERPFNGPGGTNQQRWDSFAQLHTPLFRKFPFAHAAGNHEIEDALVKSVLNDKTETFAYPDSIPFQSYAARYPAPGIVGNFGDITANLYYSTVLGGVAKLLVLNSYIPFHEKSKQYAWASNELASYSKDAIPWLIVMFHAAPYHSYVAHYKEMDYFMSVYEPLFYKAGVDFVVSGHVHAYERSRPMFNYTADPCGAVYITIGDGGNVEGNVRQYVDDAGSPCNNWKQSVAKASQWGGVPGYQARVHPPGTGAKTITLQAPVDASNGDAPVFCQSAQPAWSAYRDASFGSGILTLQSDVDAVLEWYRFDKDGQSFKADEGRYTRANDCPPARRRARLQELVRGTTPQF